MLSYTSVPTENYYVLNGQGSSFFGPPFNPMGPDASGESLLCGHEAGATCWSTFWRTNRKRCFSKFTPFQYMTFFLVASVFTFFIVSSYIQGLRTYSDSKGEPLTRAPSVLSDVIALSPAETAVNASPVVSNASFIDSHTLRPAVSRPAVGDSGDNVSLPQQPKRDARLPVPLNDSAVVGVLSAEHIRAITDANTTMLWAGFPGFSVNKGARAASHPLYLSQTTLQDAAGRKMLARDDKMCNKSGLRLYDPASCLGAPYLYVTFHGGFNSKKRVKNVCKYTRDGCSMGSVLYPSKQHTFHSLRGMLHRVGDTFLVAEAWRKSSRVLEFSGCNPTLQNRRELLSVLVDGSTHTGSGMIHPYGFAKAKDSSYFYVSSQGTSAVLRFRIDNGAPAALPRSQLLKQKESILEAYKLINSSSEINLDDITDDVGSLVSSAAPVQLSDISRKPFHEGTFVALSGSRVRGVAVDGFGRLYVANKDRGLMVFDQAGVLLTILPVYLPISVYYCEPRSSIWVGSAGKHRLYEYGIAKWDLVQTIYHKDLAHPAGLVTFGDSLFVVSQQKNKLLQFSMVTGQLERVVLSQLIDAGEQILLSDC